MSEKYTKAKLQNRLKIKTTKLIWRKKVNYRIYVNQDLTVEILASNKEELIAKKFSLPDFLVFKSLQKKGLHSLITKNIIYRISEELKAIPEELSLVEIHGVKKFYQKVPRERYIQKIEGTSYQIETIALLKKKISREERKELGRKIYEIYKSKENESLLEKIITRKIYSDFGLFKENQKIKFIFIKKVKKTA